MNPTITGSRGPAGKGFVITTIVAVLGLVWSICNTLWQVSEHQRSEYEENAYRYRPDLVISHVGFLLSFKSDTAIVDTTESAPTIVLQIRYDTARVRLYFANEGNSDARLIGFGVADSASTTPLFRNGILKEDSNLQIVEWRRFYQEFSVGRGCVDSIETNLILTKNPGEGGIFHFVLFYLNQRDCLFDTYCWMPYRLDCPRLSQVEKHATPTRSIIRFAESREKLSDQLVRMEDKRLDRKSYTRDEAAVFKARMASRSWQGRAH